MFIECLVSFVEHIQLLSFIPQKFFSLNRHGAPNQLDGDGDSNDDFYYKLSLIQQDSVPISEL